MNPNSTRIGLLLIIIMMMISVSCEKERTSAKLIKSLKGEWDVSESGPYGNTTYDVNISISAQDSSRIFIYNFYDLGDEVTANVEGHQINLVEEQKVSFHTTSYIIVSGSGTITDDYRNIDWRYQVDDGSGDVEDVTATYTKQ